MKINNSLTERSRRVLVACVTAELIRLSHELDLLYDNAEKRTADEDQIMRVGLAHANLGKALFELNSLTTKD